MSLPLPDMFSTRVLIDVVQQMREPVSFLVDTFFPQTRTFDTEYVEVETYEEVDTISEFVGDEHPSVKVDSTGYKVQYFKPGRIREHTNSTAYEILLKKSFGYNVYNPLPPERRAALEITRKISELVNRRKRLEELMASNLLTTGKLPITGRGVDFELDFGMPETNIITDVDWSDTSSKPDEDIENFRLQIMSASGLEPNMIVMGEQAYRYFKNNPHIQNLLDNRRIYVGEINPTKPENQPVKRVGDIEGTNIFVYTGTYLDKNGNRQKFLPTDGVIFGNTNAKTSRNYGLILNLEYPAAVQNYVFTKYKDDPSSLQVHIESAPLLTLSQAKAFGYMTVSAP